MAIETGSEESEDAVRVDVEVPSETMPQPKGAMGGTKEFLEGHAAEPSRTTRAPLYPAVVNLCNLWVRDPCKGTITILCAARRVRRYTDTFF